MFTSVGSIAPASITTASADIYIVNGQSSTIDATTAAAIQQFVSNGGGLVIGAQAWYWSYSKPVPSHPSNLVLTKMGIFVSGSVSASDFSFTGTPPTQIGNADVGIECIKASCIGETSNSCFMADDGQLTNAMQSLNDAAGVVPPDAPFWATVQQVGFRDFDSDGV
jgi:hypothetical protein